MKPLLKMVALFSVMAAACLAEKIDLGAGKAIHLVLPENWTSDEKPLGETGLPASIRSLRYITKSGSNDAVLISIMPVPDERFADANTLKSMVEQATEQFVQGSVEGKADLKELKIAGVTGYLVTFTDANLVGKPSVKDDYKALTCCFAFLGEKTMVTATIFTDDLAGKAYAEGMRIVKSLSLDLPKNAL